jgi:hypothetical protein
MDLDALAPIIEEIVKESLSDRVYMYGRTGGGKTNRVASGTLRNSVKAKVQPNKQGIQVIQLQALGKPMINTYAYWLVNDRGPGNVAKGVIEEWIMNKKSFRIRDMKTGRYLPKNETNIKRVAYVIRRSMKTFGFKNQPKNFWEISVDKIFSDPRITEIIQEATFEDLLKLIEGI